VFATQDAGADEAVRRIVAANLGRAPERVAQPAPANKSAVPVSASVAASSGVH